MKIKKLLYIFSGTDYRIIKRCDKSIQLAFMIVGIFIITIFIISFISGSFAFTELFQSYLIGIPLAIFFSLMITNIYLLIMYTLSKNSFPHLSVKSAKFIAIGMRISFICFIAILVSKPLEKLIFFNISENNDIENYKQKQIEKYTQFANRHFEEEVKNLKLILEKEATLNPIHKKITTINYKQIIQKKEEQKNKLIVEATARINRNNYYIQSIIMLNKNHKLCWGITTISIIIFLCPIYVRKKMAAHSEYYKFKKDMENKLVLKAYDTFKKTYHTLLRKRYKKKLYYSEIYIDPPFNTIRKKDERVFLTEENLISDLSNG